MRQNTPEFIGIGELSRRTAVPVRTIRFYCDEGLLTPHRTSGGHRVFDPVESVATLTLLRRLRALGLGIAAITRVLDGTLPVEEAVAAERRAADDELADLAWRRAALHAVETAAPTRRGAHLELLAAVGNRRAAHDTLLTFWRRLLGPTPHFEAFASMNIPEFSTAPSANQLLAFAELVGHVAAPGTAAAMSRHIWRSRPADIEDRHRLLTGVAEACELVAPLLSAEIAPRPGPELDRFIAAHATARRARDTADFRRALLRAAPGTDPRIARYWDLTDELVGPGSTGAAHTWLHRALADAVAPALS